jgi:hypothetical protein
MDNPSAPASAGTERQQQFLSDGFIDLIKVQRGLTFVAQQFLNVGTALFGNLDSRILDVDNVHLERFHEKVLVVPTAGTGQRHACILFRRQIFSLQNLILWAESGRCNAESDAVMCSWADLRAVIEPKDVDSGGIRPENARGRVQERIPSAA